MKYYSGPRTWTNSLERPKQWKMDMRSGTWNDKILYKAGLLKTGASEIAKRKF